MYNKLKYVKKAVTIYAQIGLVSRKEKRDEKEMKKKHDMIEILYKKYHQSLFIIALSYTKDEHWAKDLVQKLS